MPHHFLAEMMNSAPLRLLIDTHFEMCFSFHWQFWKQFVNVTGLMVLISGRFIFHSTSKWNCWIPKQLFPHLHHTGYPWQHVLKNWYTVAFHCLMEHLMSITIHGTLYVYYLISFIFYKAHRIASEFSRDNALSPLADKSQSRKTKWVYAQGWFKIFGLLLALLFSPS